MMRRAGLHGSLRTPTWEHDDDEKSWHGSLRPPLKLHSHLSGQWQMQKDVACLKRVCSWLQASSVLSLPILLSS